MKKFTVVFSEEAKQDIRESLRWGTENWGPEMALRWFRDIRSATRKILSIVPNGQPTAPEGKDLRRPIRHLIIGRYRVLFEVKGRTVFVIHIVGPYSEPEQKVVEIYD